MFSKQISPERDGKSDVSKSLKRSAPIALIARAASCRCLQ